MKDYWGKPLWDVQGDGGDFNTYLSRMSTLTITDEVGDDSDKFAITLEDDDPEHQLPVKDAEVKVKIGWHKNNMVEKGYYKYDSCNLAGPQRTMTLNFTAADMKGTLKARRSASYINKSLPEIAEEIAKRNGLKSKIVGDVPKEKIEQIHQTAESDMSFLLRITGERNLFAKPSFGQIVVGKPGTGEDSNVHDIDISEITEWEADLQARSVATKVTARVEVIGEGGAKYVEEGDSDATGKGGGKDVTRELLQTYRDEQAAKAGAKASLEQLNREAGTIKIVMPGDPKFFAEDYINIKGFSVKVDGKWRLTSVVDVISSDSWVTTLEGERQEDVMGSDKPEVVRFPVGDGGKGGVTPGGPVRPQG